MADTKPAKKKNPNRLVVDEAGNDDNSVVALNTQLLEAAFDDVPWDDVATLADAKAALGLSAVSRHVRSPPGTDGWRNEVRAVHNTLSGVKGELCAFPTDFLRGETLAPSLLAKLFVGRRLFQ